MRKLIAKINSYRNIDNLSFNRFLDVMKYYGDLTEACEIEISYPEYLMMNYQSITYKDIASMPWGEVKTRMRIIAKKQLAQAETLEKVFLKSQSSVLGDKYGNVLVNAEEWK